MNHDICADAASRFRTNGEAWRVQGRTWPSGCSPSASRWVRARRSLQWHRPPEPDGRPGQRHRGATRGGTGADALPRCQPDAGRGDAAAVLRRPVDSIVSAGRAETRWEMELAEPGRATARLFSDGPTGSTARSRSTAPREPGPAAARGTSTRAFAAAGPQLLRAVSNAMLATTTRAGAPTNVQRLANSALLRNRSTAIAGLPLPARPPWPATRCDSSGAPSPRKRDQRSDRRPNGSVDGGRSR